MTAATVPFELHLEVWVLIAGALALGWYTLAIVQPKALALGYEPISRSQKIWFGLATASMWVVSDWPVHEIAEQHLYFVHMLQHLFLSMLIPAMFLLATPRWLFELVLQPDSMAWRVLRTGSKPLVAGLAFNALTVFLHWSRLVQWSFESGALHFALHLMVFSVGLLMWMPVIGPVREWRLSPVAQCFYLFSMSIVPTVPGGWLVFAEDVVYRHYDVPDRLWGIGALTDQQAAGVVMKLVGGFVLWGIIFIIFTRWAQAEMRAGDIERQEQADRRRADRARAESLRSNADTDGDATGDSATADPSLTFDQIQAEFARTPAPAEPDR